jgi:hypothetical protein
MIASSFRLASTQTGRLGLVDSGRSNKMDRILFGGTPGVAILSMHSISWNLDSPGQFNHDLISSIDADTTPNK